MVFGVNDINSSNTNEKIMGIIVDMLQNFCIGNLHIFTDDGAICSAPKRQKLMTVFDCPRDGCTKSFTRNLSLENHLLLGVTIHKTAHDKAKVLYGTKVNDLFTNTSAVIIRY